MKDIIKMMGIIAFIAVIGFTMAACSTDGGDDPPVTTAPLGATLNLSGPVDLWVYDDDTDEFVLIDNFTGNREVTAIFFDGDDDDDNIIPLGGNGAITGGQFSFTIGTPNHTLPISELMSNINGEDISINNPAVQAVGLNLRTPSGFLFREHKTETIDDQVQYIYVADDVTISAGKSSFSGDQYGTETLSAFTINLKKGWNALRFRYVVTSTNPYSATMTFSAANPGHLRWVLHEFDY